MPESILTAKGFLLIVISLMFIVTALIADNVSDLEELRKRLLDNPNDIETLMLLARRYQGEAVEGDSSSLEKAEELFKRVLEISPDHPEALAWLGSVKLLRARDSWFPPSKLWYLNTGSRDLDSAISMDPDNPIIRLVRAMSYISIPAIFMKRGTAIGDLEYIILLRDRRPGTVENDVLAHAHFLLGKHYYDSDGPAKADFHFKKAIETAPDSTYGLAALDMLDK